MTEAVTGQQKAYHRAYEKLSGSTLKLIAMLAMVIDHVAMTVLYTYVAYTPMDTVQWDRLNVVYTVMRSIGRTAFPLFCFLLCEGFFHTRSRGKYAARLFAFALLSELPFDLAAAGTFTMGAQNVFFTLLIGFLALWGIDSMQARPAGRGGLRIAEVVTVFLAGAVLAELLCTDYGAMGVLLILIFYLLHANRLLACLTGYLCFLFEPWCFPAFLLIMGYSGKRGLRLKYVFYAFYPLHLLVLYCIAQMIAA